MKTLNVPHGLSGNWGSRDEGSAITNQLVCLLPPAPEGTGGLRAVPA